MYLRSFLPTGLFSICGLGACYSSSLPLFDTHVTSHFYQDSRLFNRFEYEDFLFIPKIETDFLGVRNYFFNNSFRLIFKENQNQYKSNAFLLNILYPDWVMGNESEKSGYVPSRYHGGEELVLLLGIPLTFADKVFQNNQTNMKNGDLFFSHPWPNTDEDSKNYRLEQKTLYTLDDKSDTYHDFDYSPTKPFYFKLENNNTTNKVELVYKAIDLQINKNLLDIGFDSLDSRLRRIHTQEHSNVEWFQEITVDNEKRKFAVNFAVIKATINIINIKKSFLNYLLKYYDKSLRIPPIFKSSLDVIDGKTNKVYMGGWDGMDDNEIEYHTMSNLYAKPEAKSGQTLNSKKPSETTFETCCEIKFYYSPSQDSNASEYSAEILNKYPNDESGIMWVEYKIKNTSKNIVYPEVRTIVFSGFKSGASSGDVLSQAASSLNTYSSDKNKKFADFFGMKPKAESVWKEFEIEGSYISYKNISDLTKNPKFLTFNNTTYLDISHHFEIPNMNLKDYEGSVAITNDSNSEKSIIGMYGKTETWDNPMSKHHRKVGNIMMFISPWRYDLFNENNNLSKPTLATTLKDKQYKDRLIQTGRWLYNP